MDNRRSDLAYQFMASANIFAVAVEAAEAQLWREVGNRQLSIQQVKLLRLVRNSGTHTVGDIAALLGISNAAASKAVDKLVKLMLLRRGESEADRRAIHLSLTSAGRRALGIYEEAIQSRLTKILAPHSTEELERIIEMLDRLSVEIVRHDAGPDPLCVQCGIYFADKCILRQGLERACIYARQRMKGTERCQQSRSD